MYKKTDNGGGERLSRLINKYQIETQMWRVNKNHKKNITESNNKNYRNNNGHM